uniref:Uncharacterized protein n=1 Tax=Ananas comosus var. bracteatus TaxID=296719 RepID=A0A6V7PE71_ANACO|nr:unnamed protein product [Ananas comosus var. bracteatus]
MGDKATLAKARQELEELYLGVPDDSVDLSFKDLLSFQQNEVAERKTANISMLPIREERTIDGPKTSMISSFGKSPSLDFVKGLQAVRDREQNIDAEQELHRERVARNSFKRAMLEGLGMCIYIYFFRHRCLVCGRVYCRQCVRIGMGEMSEGRKCTECLGRRFSQRYIERAGKMGCCWQYPGEVKLQELIWAEKGPRRSGERRGRADGVSRSMLGTPTRSRPSVSRSPMIMMVPGTPRSFVSTTSLSSYAKSSTFSPNPHAFPL